MSRKEILFAAQNLNIGGVQKAFVNYLKKLSESGEYEISVFAFTGGVLSEKLPKNIKTEYGGRLLGLSAQSFGDIRKNGSVFDIFLRMLITVFAKTIGTKRFYRLCFKKRNKNKGNTIGSNRFFPTCLPWKVFRFSIQYKIKIKH